MKLKVNNKILLGLITIGIFALSGCSIPSTATAVIVDTKGNPVTKAGITVTAVYGNLSPVKTPTLSDGTATLKLPNIAYPVVITASDDAADKFSIVTIANQAEMSNKITIVENPLTVIKDPVNIK